MNTKEKYKISKDLYDSIYNLKENKKWEEIEIESLKMVCSPKDLFIFYTEDKDKHEEVVKELDEIILDVIKSKPEYMNLTQERKMKISAQTQIPWHQITPGIVYGIKENILTFRNGEIIVKCPEKYWEIDKVDEYVSKVKFAKKN